MPLRCCWRCPRCRWLPLTRRLPPLPRLPPTADRRGLKCRWRCGRRANLLRLLVPALRVPLRLVEANGEEAAGVAPPPDLDDELAAAGCAPGPGCATATPGSAGAVDRLGGVLSQVVATLQQPLLLDVGIRCSAGPLLETQLHRCREQAARQFGGWAGGAPVPAAPMVSLLGQVAQVEVRWGWRWRCWWGAAAGLLSHLCLLPPLSLGRLPNRPACPLRLPPPPAPRRRRCGGWTRCSTRR